MRVVSTIVTPIMTTVAVWVAVAVVAAMVPVLRGHVRSTRSGRSLLCGHLSADHKQTTAHEEKDNDSLKT